MWLSSLSRLPRALTPFPGSDKLQHAAWFFLLALLTWQASREGEGWGRCRRTATVLAALALWGVGDEWHQSFVPGRAAEAADVLADVAGTVLALAVAEAGLSKHEVERERG